MWRDEDRQMEGERDRDLGGERKSAHTCATCAHICVYVCLYYTYHVYIH